MENRKLRSLLNENNCSNFSKNKLSINQLTNLNDDKCENVGRNIESNNINDYMLTNFASCNCDLNEVLKTSSENVGLTVKDGFGLSECNVQQDSDLRVGNVERHYKSDMQLFPRPFLTTPSVIKGEQNTPVESNLFSPILGRKHKALDNVDETRIYTPLLPNMLNFQSENHLIQETVNSKWVRGGINTKQIVTDVEYFAKSNDNKALKNQLLKQKTYLH